MRSGKTVLCEMIVAVIGELSVLVRYCDQMVCGKSCNELSRRDASRLNVPSGSHLLMLDT